MSSIAQIRNGVGCLVEVILEIEASDTIDQGITQKMRWKEGIEPWGDSEMGLTI